MVTKQIQSVIVQNEDGVSLITLNEPDRRNALSPGIMGGVIQALREAEYDDSIHCIVLTGAGSAFCAGGDVMGFKNKAETHARPPWQPAAKDPHYSQPLRNGSKPVIAAVNGSSVGAGFQLALMCDVRIASDKARFGALWIMRALDAAGGGCYFLPRSIGLSNAFWMIYTGEMIDANQALDWHLVTKVVPHDQLIPYTMEMARKIARHPIIPLQMNRRMIYRALDTPYETIAEWQFAQRLTMYATEDHLESARAFLEKRPPVYKGR